MVMGLIDHRREHCSQLSSAGTIQREQGMPGSKRRSVSRKQKYEAARKALEAQVQDLARSAAAADKAASAQHQAELVS